MPKILIVEDNLMYREALKHFIASKFPDMDIEEAKNAKEALTQINDGRPDLIFMDIKLQNDNGLELARKIKAKYPDIVVAIITQYNEAEYLRAAYQYGAEFFISKSSSDKKEIMRIIESISPQKTSPKNIYKL
ncbi:MAG: response regulator transcription factor [Desulfobacterales bacterium]|jgi:DNA-binding NarL/FixJ family response regulator